MHDNDCRFIELALGSYDIAYPAARVVTISEFYGTVKLVERTEGSHTSCLLHGLPCALAWMRVSLLAVSWEPSRALET